MLKEHVVLSMDLAFMSPFALPRTPKREFFSRGVWLGLDRLEGLVFWNPEAVINHCGLVLGPMGCGKTTMLKTLMYRARKMLGLPVWVIDPAGEYVEAVEACGGRVYNMASVKVNPMLLCGQTPTARWASVCDSLKYAVGLSDDEAGLVQEALEALYSEAGVKPEDPETWVDDRLKGVTVSGLYFKLRSMFESAPEGTLDHALLRSLIPKLTKLAAGAHAFNRTDIVPHELLSETVCFNLKELAVDLRKLVVWTLLEQLYDHMYYAGELSDRLKLMVFIDEAHLFIKPEVRYVAGRAVPVEPPLFRHMRLMRKFGVGYWACTHVPEDVPDEVWKTVGTIVLFGSTERDYLAFCAEKLNLTNEDVQNMMFFGRGEAFIKARGEPRPAYLKVVPQRL